MKRGERGIKQGGKTRTKRVYKNTCDIKGIGTIDRGRRKHTWGSIARKEQIRIKYN